MHVRPPSKADRLAAFKRVLATAAMRPLTSPALHVYYAAKSDDERRAAYPALTARDRDAIVDNARTLMEADMKVRVAEIRANDAALKAHFEAKDAAVEAENNARIAALPPKIRRRAELMRRMRKGLFLVASGIGILFVAAQVTGEVGYFAWSLIHDWIFWAAMIGANLAIFAIVMVAAHCRTIVAVLGSLPVAIRAAISPPFDIEEQKPNQTMQRTAGRSDA